MRARNIKPSFFTNELLAVSDPIYGWVFEGLWCYGDREGRMEDRPAKIHMRINSGRAFETTVVSLDWLAGHGFILRYVIGGIAYIQIVNFAKHQNPHWKEPLSAIPAPPPELLEALRRAAGPGFEGHAMNESLGQSGHECAIDAAEALDKAPSNPGLEGHGMSKSPADSGFRIPDSSPLTPLEQPRGKRAMNGAKPRVRRSSRDLRHESATAWDLVLQHLGAPAEVERQNLTAHRAVVLMGGYQRIGRMNTRDTPKLKPVFREHYERLVDATAAQEAIP